MKCFMFSHLYYFFKDIVLVIGVIYVVVIRIFAWTCWNDFDNTPSWKELEKGQSNQELV